MPGHLKGPHTLESECRYDQGQRIGEVGGVYEFDIKIPPIRVEMTDKEYDWEARHAVMDFIRRLQDRYSWVGEMRQTGRSGGWLMIVDQDGGATKAKLQVIIGMVTTAKKRFVKRLERDFPR